MYRKLVMERSNVLLIVAQLAGFAALTALAARVTIPLPNTPVPITLQVMAVLLAGLVLGSRLGALSQIAYLSAIAVGLPLDAYGVGSAALVGPTAGYLWGFVPAAFVVGFVAERWQMRPLVVRLVASMAGVGVIYIVGASWLAVVVPSVDSVQAAWAAGVAPFIIFDVGKAIVAAAVAEGGRRLFVT